MCHPKITYYWTASTSPMALWLEFWIGCLSLNSIRFKDVSWIFFLLWNIFISALVWLCFSMCTLLSQNSFDIWSDISFHVFCKLLGKAFLLNCLWTGFQKSQTKSEVTYCVATRPIINYQLSVLLWVLFWVLFSYFFELKTLLTLRGGSPNYQWLTVIEHGGLPHKHTCIDYARLHKKKAPAERNELRRKAT